jgi:hypothetical protein
MKKARFPLRALVSGVALLAACDNKPMVMSEDMNTGGGADMAGTALLCAPFPAPLTSCACSVDDYAPRYEMSRYDTWPRCVSDSGEYKLQGTGRPAAAARTEAWDMMATKLWANIDRAPSAQDFSDARDLYNIDQGIASRVARRQDVHYPELPVMDGKKFACTDAGLPAMYPDRCAGPARLQPIINDAFQRGAAQTEPRVQAARIEAALLWFFYLSTLSEVWTSSFEKIEDIDSMWGYYNAAQQRGGIAGIARYINPLSPEAHQRAFDGILAGRCWRDLDPSLPAKDLGRYQRALNQLDKAELYGLGRVLRDRIGKLGASTGEIQRAHLAFVSILGQLMDRAARAVDAARADVLKAQIGVADPAQVNVKAAQDAIDALFPCP